MKYNNKRQKVVDGNFLGDHNKNFTCRRCLNSYTSENMLTIHKSKCEKKDITTIRISSESQIDWKNLFNKNPIYFGIYADSEGDREKDNSNIGNKTANIYKQNPVLNGYNIISEMDDVLESGSYKSPLGYDKVDWLVDEVVKIENNMAFYFKNTNKGITKTQENEEDFENNSICRLCGKKTLNLIKLQIFVI